MDGNLCIMRCIVLIVDQEWVVVYLVPKATPENGSLQVWERQHFEILVVSLPVLHDDNIKRRPFFRRLSTRTKMSAVLLMIRVDSLT